MSDIKEGQLYRIYNKKGNFYVFHVVMSNDNKYFEGEKVFIKGLVGLWRF